MRKTIISVLLSVVVLVLAWFGIGANISIHDEDKAKINVDKFLDAMLIKSDYNVISELSADSLKSDLDENAMNNALKSYTGKFGSPKNIKTTNYMPQGKKGMYICSVVENSKSPSYVKTWVEGSMFRKYKISGVYFSPVDFPENQKGLHY